MDGVRSGKYLGEAEIVTGEAFLVCAKLVLLEWAKTRFGEVVLVSVQWPSLLWDFCAVRRRFW